MNGVLSIMDLHLAFYGTFNKTCLLIFSDTVVHLAAGETTKFSGSLSRRGEITEY